MNSLVVYYSYSGNTKNIAEKLGNVLSGQGQVDYCELTPTDESNNFFAQCARALTNKRASIAAVNFDLSEYDLVCLGTPVWAFAPTPAVNTFLDNCQNLDNKLAISFTTYGSGSGVKKCVSTIDNTLKKKGVSKVSNFNIQQNKINDTAYVERLAQGALKEVGIA
jgi:flavodoxin